MKLIKLMMCGVFLMNLNMAFAKGDKKGFMKEVLSQLNLTEEQKTKLKELRKDKKPKKSDHGEIKKLREELQAKYASNASESELKSIHNKIKELRNSKIDNRFERMTKIRSVLTLEQRKKFQELMQQKRQSRKGSSR